MTQSNTTRRVDNQRGRIGAVGGDDDVMFGIACHSFERWKTRRALRHTVRGDFSTDFSRRLVLILVLERMQYAHARHRHEVLDSRALV